LTTTRWGFKNESRIILEMGRAIGWSRPRPSLVLCSRSLPVAGDGTEMEREMSDANLVAKLDPAVIDGIFASVDHSHLPGAAVAVAIDGIPVYRKGFGLANLELPVALSPTMRMRIGSTSKHFASFAYMLLCEEGRAALDDEIGKYCPEFHEVTRHVTVRQLMGHTSGVRDIVALTMFLHGTGVPVTDKQLLAYYNMIDDTDFAPEQGWSYNNGGYMMITAAIERITGGSLDDFLTERVFKPIGMHDTMMRRWDTDFVPNSATLHMVDPAGGYVKHYMGMEITGMGGMVSTMDDMLRWLRHMDQPIVGSAETWRLMKTPRTLANGQSTGYGQGLISMSYRGVETLSHSGGVMGGNSQMIKVPGARLDISVAANRGDVSSLDLANKIIDACVEGLDPVAEAGDVEKLTGLFVSSGTGRVVELLEQDDKPLLSVDSGPALPLSPDGNGGFGLTPPLDFMRLGIVPSDKGICFSDFGNEDRLDEVERASDAKLDAFVGSYTSSMLDATADISDGADGPRLRMVGRHGSHAYKLAPLTPLIWKASSLGAFSALSGVIAFDADGSGLVMNATRAVGLRFTRA
jgi:CubicO group peptidase (beta-lactamase class C family)